VLATMPSKTFFFLSFRLLTISIKIKIYRTVMLSVLYVCETWSLTLRKEHTLGVFVNRVLRRLFGLRRKMWKAGDNGIVRSCIVCTFYKKILLG
jgi:hypothetical protein